MGCSFREIVPARKAAFFLFFKNLYSVLPIYIPCMSDLKRAPDLITEATSHYVVAGN